MLSRQFVQDFLDTTRGLGKSCPISFRADPPNGSVATLSGPPEIGLTTVNAVISSGQFEELFDELNLTPNIVPIGCVATASLRRLVA